MFPFDIGNLGASFKRYFEIVPALTDELRDHAYRIRHQVYCEDLKYEPQRSDRRESDEYDAHSLHCLIRSVKTGEFAGCTRLILCRPDDPHYPLPFERTCAQTIDRSIIDPQTLSRRKIAEVSRLAVVSRFRTRRGERHSPAPLSDESFGTGIMPRFPYVPVALYLATTELAALHGIHTMFLLSEPRLVRHFARLGVDIIQIGDEVEHRGTRIPSVVNVRKIIEGLNFIMRPLYDVVAREVRDGVREQPEQEPQLQRGAVIGSGA
jgi:N-acyl amino acid synthase of PEP-CTERM/exosortase system